jgi:ribosomal protein S18 acetylase RimI-like enzyme
MSCVRATSAPGVTLRRCGQKDMEFLYRVYAASRADEMAMLMDWSAAQKEQFLRSQFAAQHRHYREYYPDARYEIIVGGSEDIGRLYVASMLDQFRVVDIALLPAYRNQGIGRTLMQDVLAEARRERKFVSLYVEETNPAKGLYERLGFSVVGEVSFYKLMHWLPPQLEPLPADAPPPAAMTQLKTAS